MPRRAWWTGVAVATAAAACGTSSLEVLGPGGGLTVAPDGGVAQVAPDGAPVDTGSRADFCAGLAPVICTGGLAQSAFRYALCTCEGLVSAVSITTDSFDADAGAYDPTHAGAGGSLGTNGNLSAQGTLAIGGAIWVGDPTGMSVDRVTTRGELHSNGRMAGGALVSIGADAFVVGDVTAQGDLTISGTLHQPAGHTATASGTKTIAATVTESVVVPQACDCNPALLIDVPSYVERYRAKNDDGDVGIDPRALENVNSDLTLNVACGRVFFTRIGGTGAIHLVLASGHTAIFIGGDVAPSGAFTVDVPDGGELDVFVEGNVVAGSTFALGSQAAPSHARLYVGGSGTVNLQNASTLAGNVYAPKAELVLGPQLTTVFGSIFARRVSTQGSLAIHYDEQVLNAGSSCAAPTTCTSCHDCGNQACIAGACGACTTSADCCAPLLCQAGRCVAQIR